MISPALRTIPQVNLDEFERRLRAATTTPSAHEDPLAELARLVGLDGAPQRLTENVVTLAPRAPQTAESVAFAATISCFEISRTVALAWAVRFGGRGAS